MRINVNLSLSTQIYSMGGDWSLCQSPKNCHSLGQQLLHQNKTEISFENIDSFYFIKNTSISCSNAWVYYNFSFNVVIKEAINFFFFVKLLIHFLYWKIFSNIIHTKLLSFLLFSTLFYLLRSYHNLMVFLLLS